ncbi:unnamed protein product [Dovyalis caffra]|uniref:BTB domain-containing protein n=1 Tax=Dovyalis caffra TaxID=77055 RepID=A0AAV1QV03_9ROSI|nr:unnamed protein product [Dovyalis caffra]
MAESAVSLVIDKLVPLLTQEVDLLKGVHKEVEEIKDDLEAIRAFLKDADSRAEKEGVSNSVQIWVKQAREVAYQIEDVVDVYILHMAQHRDRRGFVGFLHRMSSLVTKWKPRHEIASKIQDVRKGLQNIKERIGAFQFISSEQGASSGHARNIILHDPRLCSLSIEEAELVGAESSRDELIRHLVSGESHRRVISVVGVGGVGKTTIARKVYDNHQVKGHFRCRVWITVPQEYDRKELLRSLLNKFYQGKKEVFPQSIATMDDSELINKLREYLQLERYLVVFDDVWEVCFWGDVEHALLDNDNGSRILITTRNEDVATFCRRSSLVQVHQMKPLPKKESWELFCKKAFKFELEGKCPKDLEELSHNIVRRCGGLPLAIVAVGGLLATKEKVVLEWKTLLDSLGSALTSDPHLVNITKILSLSYGDLPHHLKRCFLYFGMFPEDFSIQRKRLIRLWMAEGFVQEKRGRKSEEVAEEYLTELVHRNLVQADKFNLKGSLKKVCVHDMVREVILSNSEELSFCHISTDCSTLQGIARHLSIIDSEGDNPKIRVKSQTRSLMVFSRVESQKPIIDAIFKKCKMLTSLDFERCPINYIPKELGNLLHLKYFNLRNTKVSKLPKSIGKLQNLEFLDVRHSLVKELPVEINRFCKLQYLWGCPALKIHGSIGHLEFLQTLFGIRLDDDQGLRLITELGMLKQLRRLVITIKKEYVRDLCTVLERMTQLQSLHVQLNTNDILEVQSMSSPPAQLQTLSLRGRLERFPNWISKQQNVVKLGLWNSRLRDDSIKVLQALPNLKFLILVSGYNEEKMHFEEGGFQKLMILHLTWLNELKMMTIDKGALPLLKTFYIGPCPQLKEVPFGIQHLKQLEKLCFVGMSKEFTQRLSGEEGEDYWKVKHVPILQYDGTYDPDDQTSYAAWVKRLSHQRIKMPQVLLVDDGQLPHPEIPIRLHPRRGCALLPQKSLKQDRSGVERIRARSYFSSTSMREFRSVFQDHDFVDGCGHALEQLCPSGTLTSLVLPDLRQLAVKTSNFIPNRLKQIKKLSPCQTKQVACSLADKKYEDRAQKSEIQDWKAAVNQKGIFESVAAIFRWRDMREHGKDLCIVLEKMTHLRTLFVASVNDKINDVQSMSCPPPNLGNLSLWGELERFPDWIPKLHNLAKLTLGYSRLMDDPIEVLQTLPNLKFLGLIVDTMETRCILKEEGSETQLLGVAWIDASLTAGPPILSVVYTVMKIENGSTRSNSIHAKHRVDSSIVVKYEGVTSMALGGAAKDQIVVIGEEVDSVKLGKSLRKKVGNANIMSVEEEKDKGKDEKDKGKDKGSTRSNSIHAKHRVDSSIVVKYEGVTSMALGGAAKDQIVVIGEEVDSVKLGKSLRKKVGNANIMSVEEEKDKGKDEKDKGKDKGSTRSNSIHAKHRVDNSIVVKYEGVTSVALGGAAKDQIVVIGEEVDSVKLGKSLRKKVGNANIMSVEEEKDKGKDEKKEEEKYPWQRVKNKDDLIATTTKCPKGCPTSTTLPTLTCKLMKNLLASRNQLSSSMFSKSRVIERVVVVVVVKKKKVIVEVVNLGKAGEYFLDGRIFDCIHEITAALAFARMTDSSAYRVETTSRLAQWRIDNPASCTYRKSDPFKIGKWNWHLSVEKNRVLFVKLYPEISTQTRENPPIASFIIRIVSSVGDRKALTHPEVTDKQLKNNDDFVWAIDVPLTGKFIIDVEFIDLKAACPGGGEPCSIWDEETTEKRSNATALVSFGRMLTESIHTDIKINASDGSIGAHRAVLAARSPVFHSMFAHDLKEKELSTINISDMSIEACQAFLNYIYGNIQHEEFLAHRLALLSAADKYDIADLKEACHDSLLEDIDTKNVLERLQSASLYELPKLKTSCLRYLVKFGKIFDIQDDFNAFIQCADRDLIAEVFHDVLNAWKGF